MSLPSYYEALEDNLRIFLEHWGPINWRVRIKDVQGEDNPLLAKLFGAFAGIEDDAFYMQKKLRYSGTARLEPVKQFNAVWLVEEADHGRIMAALAAKYHGGRAATLRDHRTFSRDRRAILAVPIMKALSAYERGMLAAYLTLGMLVEYVAVTSYNSLAQIVDDPIARDIVSEVSRQEGRHMRFYRKGAIAVMDGDIASQRFVRYISRYWRPPGVDLYGFERWVAKFEPLLNDPDTYNRYLRMDELFSELPGQNGSRLMKPFLDRCMATLHELERDKSLEDVAA